MGKLAPAHTSLLGTQLQSTLTARLAMLKLWPSSCLLVRLNSLLIALANRGCIAQYQCPHQLMHGAAYTTCTSRSYVDCNGLSDYAVFFLNRTFDDVDAISYGYSTTIPETQTVYTAGYPGEEHQATVACYSPLYGNCSLFWGVISASVILHLGC